MYDSKSVVMLCLYIYVCVCVPVHTHMYTFVHLHVWVYVADLVHCFATCRNLCGSVVIGGFKTTNVEWNGNFYFHTVADIQTPLNLVTLRNG